MKYNQFLQECLTKSAKGDSNNVTGDTSATNGNRSANDGPQVEARDKIGLLDTEPLKKGEKSDKLSPEQQELLEAVFARFTVHKVNEYLDEQFDHINYKRHIGETVKQLFDENGKPPVNAPLEDIIAARKKLEDEIHMLEAVCSAMRVSLSQVQEIEDLALELVNGQFEK